MTIVAVVDTNVLAELATDLDFVRAFIKAGEHLDAPEPKYRLCRARGSLLCALFLHESGKNTLSHFQEAMRVLDRALAKLDQEPDENLKNWSKSFGRVFAHFVKPTLLSGWGLGNEDQEPDLKGNATDRWLLDQADALGLPLITNEGVKEDGSEDVSRDGRKKLRCRGRQRGVRVQLPIEFFDERHEPAGPIIERFYARYIREAPAYAATEAKTQDEYEYVLRVLNDVLNVYRLIVTGETDETLPNVDVRAWP